MSAAQHGTVQGPRQGNDENRPPQRRRQGVSGSGLGSKLRFNKTIVFGLHTLPLLILHLSDYNYKLQSFYI